MSSQDELLAVLFPKAKNVRWENGNAVIVEAQEEWSSGFKNFVSAEELGLLVRHAEQPHRVSQASLLVLSFLSDYECEWAQEGLALSLCFDYST